MLYQAWLGVYLLGGVYVQCISQQIQGLFSLRGRLFLLIYFLYFELSHCYWQNKPKNKSVQIADLVQIIYVGH